MSARLTYTSHRARLTATILATLGGVLLPASAWAQANPFGSGVIDGIATASTIIVTGLQMMAWVIFFYLNILLSPTFMFDLDVVTGAPTSFMDMLNELWQFSRNLVNIVFAFALIGVAVVTIVMAKKDFVVEHWRKFVLAIILVNFSWLFPRLVLDAANVTAAAVYGLPSTIASTTNNCKTNMIGQYDANACVLNPTLGSNIYTCDCFYIHDLRMFTDQAFVAQYNGLDGWDCPLNEILCYQRKRLDFTSVAGHSAILNGLVVNHARLQALASIPANPNNSSQIMAITRFIMQEILVIAFQIMLIFPLAALFIAFLIRIPVLWLTIVGMPFYFLGWVIPEKFTGGYTEKIMQLFLKAAFLPAIVGIPLSVGFIMVNAGTRAQHVRLNNMPFNILPGINTVWEFLWTLISMGVIWVGVFAVLQKMDIMGKGSEAIKGLGQTIGGIALKLPLAAPIIPSIGGKSILALPQTIRGVDAALSQGKKWNELPGSIGDMGEVASAAQTLAPESPQNTRALTDLTTELTRVADDLKNNRIRPEAAAQRINEKTKAHFTVDATNMQTRLDDFLAEIRRNNSSNSNIPALRDGIDKLRDALRPPAAPAAAAQPAGGNPPPANPANP